MVLVLAILLLKQVMPANVAIVVENLVAHAFFGLSNGDNPADKPPLHPLDGDDGPIEKEQVDFAQLGATDAQSGVAAARAAVAAQAASRCRLGSVKLGRRARALHARKKGTKKTKKKLYGPE